MSEHYIAKSDIKDYLVRSLIEHADLTVEPYLDDVDLEMVELAFRTGVTNTEQFSTNDDGTIASNSCKMYLLYWMYRRIFEDLMGSNQLDINDEDRYMNKAKYYGYMVGKYEKKITVSEITGTRSNRTDTVRTSYGLRG